MSDLGCHQGKRSLLYPNIVGANPTTNHHFQSSVKATEDYGGAIRYGG